jgi:signal transduction histidine kinase
MRRPFPLHASDLAVAGAFAAASILGAALAHGPQAHGIRTQIVLAAGLASAVALAGRRGFPMTVLGATTACGALSAAVADRPVIGPLPIAIALYTLAARSDGRRTLFAGAAALAGYEAGTLIGHATGGAARSGPGGAVALALLAVAGTAGLYAAGRANVLTVLAERAEQLEREQHLRAVQAVLAERVWIARELHDAIGHHVSLLVVQARGDDRDATAGRRPATARLGIRA